MKRQFVGIDVLRGFALFMTLWMHTSFYYFDGLYDLDLLNPPVIVTIIGFLLMFAGLFAMISGFVSTHQSLQKEADHHPKKIRRGQWISALFLFAIGYAYFLFTGPGIVDMPNRVMDQSFLVGLILDGQWIAMSQQRWLYVDSLIMLASNLFLLSIIFYMTRKLQLKQRTRVYLVAALVFFVISLVRIPLYETYLNLLEQKQWVPSLALNWLVNKNNPIFPYLSFGLLGGWVALIYHQKRKNLSPLVLSVGGLLFVFGLLLYLVLPDTMLQRSIDIKWFAIMMFQLGLFTWVIYGFVYVKRVNVFTTYFRRLGTVSLSVFFIESVIAALVYRAFMSLFGPRYFGLGHALVFGFMMASIWGFTLIFWEKASYKFSLEHLYVRVKSFAIESSKKEKVHIQ